MLTAPRALFGLIAVVAALGAGCSSSENGERERDEEVPFSTTEWDTDFAERLGDAAQDSGEDVDMSSGYEVPGTACDFWRQSELDRQCQALRDASLRLLVHPGRQRRSLADPLPGDLLEGLGDGGRGEGFGVRDSLVQRGFHSPPRPVQCASARGSA